MQNTAHCICHMHMAQCSCNTYTQGVQKDPQQGLRRVVCLRAIWMQAKNLFCFCVRFFFVFRRMGEVQLIAELHNCAFPCIFLSHCWTGRERQLCEGRFPFGGCCIFSFNSSGICYLLPVSIAHEVLLFAVVVVVYYGSHIIIRKWRFVTQRSSCICRHLARTHIQLLLLLLLHICNSLTATVDTHLQAA